MKILSWSAASLSLCGLVSLTAATGGADAASPAYCALYAREYTAQFATGSNADAAMASEYRIQEQAFSQCLNLDVEPPFPTTSVYFGAVADDISGGGSVEEVAEGDTTPDGSDVVADEPAPAIAAPTIAAEPRPTLSQTAGRAGEGKLKPFTPEWEAWCKEHYPNSFDELTGMVTPFEGEAKICLSGS